MHDSQIFSDIFEEVSQRFPEVEAVVTDAGYKTHGICREIIESEKLPVMFYVIKKGYFKKHEYGYNEYYDCFLCPKGQVLKYSATNREVYR